MMTLRFSHTSPYARKVLVSALETGLIKQITLAPTNPWAPDTDLPADNPLGKVPALITADGMALFDSPVICEYLDSLHDGPKLFPAAGPDRWRALRQQALADGIVDAAVNRRLDAQRPPAQQSLDWQERQARAVARACATLELDAAEFAAGPPTIGAVAAACALAYLDFRFPEDDWRAGRPALSTWFGAFSQRPSMVQTVPPP